MEVILHILQPKSSPPRVHLKGTVTVGRSPECQLRLSLPEISRKHCLLTLTETELLVRDLGSSNGTRIDGRSIPHGVDHRLRNGVQLEIGPLLCRVEIREVVTSEPVTLVEGLSDTSHHIDAREEMNFDEETAQSDRGRPQAGSHRDRSQDSGESSEELPAVEWPREDFGHPSPAAAPPSTVDHADPDLHNFLKKLSE